MRKLLAAAILATAALPATAFAHVCMDDAYKFCRELIPDEAKIAQCLHERRHQLQPACAVLFDGRIRAQADRPVSEPQDRRAPIDGRYQRTQY